VAGLALNVLQLPGMDQVSYVARGCYMVSLVQALLATFFTCIQQRAHGFQEEPSTIRAWLSNGVQYVNHTDSEVLQSSIISQQILQAPFELLSISITTFLVAIGISLGSALTQHISLGCEGTNYGNTGVLIGFIVTTIFSLSLLGQLLGGKDIENRRYRKLTGQVTVASIWDREDQQEMGRRKLSSVMNERRYPVFRTSVQLPPTRCQSYSEEEKLTALIAALQQAANAHRASSAAEIEVVRCYEMISQGLLKHKHDVVNEKR
jgi:hypothetical protein